MKQKFTIPLTLDEAYYREFHEEWVQARGRGWRLDRLMVSLCLAVATSLFGLGLAMDSVRFFIYGGLLAGIAAGSSQKKEGEEASANFSFCVPHRVIEPPLTRAAFRANLLRDRPD